MAKDPLSNFEIPIEMRHFAERSVEQAKKAFDGFIAAAHQTADVVKTQADTTQSGAKDISEKAMSFAEQNIANSFDFAQKLVRARDAQEIMTLQSEFMKSQMQVLSEQAKELGESAGKVAMDTAKPKF